MNDEQRQAMIAAIKAIIPNPPLPRYYRQDEEGYLIAIGTGGADGQEITADEYEAISAVIANKPAPPAGFDYRLTTELEWEQYELPPAPDPDALPVDNPMEALELLLGGDGNE